MTPTDKTTIERLEKGRSHDISIGEMLDEEDERAIGLLGRDFNLQFVRLAAAFNDMKKERDAAIDDAGIKRLRNEALEGWCETLTRERDDARAALKEVASAGVAFDDHRLSYVEIQIERSTLNEIRAMAGLEPR